MRWTPFCRVSVAGCRTRASCHAARRSSATSTTRTASSSPMRTMMAGRGICKAHGRGRRRYGDWNIATNRASSAGSDNVATATASLSSDDHYSQFGFVSLSGAANLLTTNVRQADANNMYVGGYRNDNQWEIFERITGTFTQLGTDLSTNAVPSTSIKLSISDSTLELFRDGVSQGTRTDTSLTGTLTTGFRVTSSGAVIDDFEAADLAASTFDLDRIERRTMRGVMRGVGRGQ